MIISVASGKGGTGKTLVATSLALSLKDGHKVQLLDCDVEEPNAHILLKPVLTRQETVSIPVPSVDEAKCTYCRKCAEVCAFHAIAVLKEKCLVFSELCHGCGACAYFCPEKAITETDRKMGIVELGQAGEIDFVHGKLLIGEPMAPPVIRAVKSHLQSDMEVIIDVSPGTSCPVVEAIRGSHFCLLVTEPTPFGLYDLSLMVEVVRKLGIPCGVVLNRAGFWDGQVEDYCARERIAVLMKIPWEREIARLYSQGIPLAAGIPRYQEAFVELFRSIQQEVAAGKPKSR